MVLTGPFPLFYVAPSSPPRCGDNDGDGGEQHRLITIYDCRVVLTWTGSAADGTTASGRLVIPEVSHEITLDGLSDYVVSVLVFKCLVIPLYSISLYFDSVVPLFEQRY